MSLLVSGIPSDWSIVKLGEIISLINGDRGKNYPSKGDFVDSGVPFINAGHLRGGRICFEDMNFISPDHFVRLGSGKVSQGDIVYCLRGSLGKAAIVTDIDSGAIASSLVIVRSHSHISSRYIYYFLVSPFGFNQISEFDNGSAQPNLSAGSLSNFSLPLAPLNEQKRIADKLDAVLARVDACRDRLDRIPAILKRFRQSVLEAAFSGQLTADWKVEQGAESPWFFSTIGEICTVVRGASPRPAGDLRYFGGSVPWITVGELTKDKTKFLHSVSTFLTSEGVEKSRFIEIGTLLLTNSGATLGVPKITMIGGCINDGSVALLGLEEPLKSYLY